MAKSPKTRKLPRSTQSRPTAQFVTALYTSCIQDLRAFARKDMDHLVSQPELADRALQIAFVHKDVHLATSLMDAGACALPKPRHGSNAFCTAVNATYATTPDVRKVLARLIDRMLETGPQWVHCTAAKALDRSSPEHWIRSLVAEIKSQPLSAFHVHTLEHCLELPVAVKALLDKGAVWGSSVPPGVESALRVVLLDSEYPLDVLDSLKQVEESTRPNHAPGSDRLAKRRKFDWEAVLRINPVEKGVWFNSYHQPVLAWARQNLQIDLAYLMLLECASSNPDISSWGYNESDRASTFGTVVRLVDALHPRAKSQSKVTETITRIALRVDAGSQKPDLVRFRADMEDLVIRMVDETGFAAPDLSALPTPLDYGRLHSFCISRRMQEKVTAAKKAPVAQICTPVRQRF